MDWYEEDVQAAVAERTNCPYKPDAIFYGSSSIRLWTNLYEDFKDYKPLNLGFGGSTLAACVWFFDRIAAPVNDPQTFILYAGDNDLGDGRHPEEVLFFLREFMLKLREHFPTVPFYYISIKPSISRSNILKEIEHTNELIKQEINTRTAQDHFVNIYDSMMEDGRPIAALFEDDGLHLNSKGYEVWKEIILRECFVNSGLQGRS